MKKIGILLSISIAGILIFSRYQTSEEPRTAYESYLQNHPFNQKEELTPKEWKRLLPKKDRPDLAREHDFFMTLDPALRTVPRERLFQAYETAEQLRQNNSREVAWTEHGPNNVAGRTRAIMFDPNDPTIKQVWAGGVAGGLWTTTDITVENPNWINIDDFWDNIAITTITYDPTNPNIFYVGTGEGWYNGDAVRGAGIFRSEDGGNTWTHLSSTMNESKFYYVQKIEIHPTTGEVFAATRGYYSNEGGVFRSTDNGESWTRVLGPTQTGNSNSAAADLEISSNGTIFASMGILYSDGFYKSTDGVNWQKLNTGTNGFPNDNSFRRLEFDVSSSNPECIYVVGQSSSGSSEDVAFILKSTDTGTSWTSLTIPNNMEGENGNMNGGHFTRGQAWYNLILAVDPTNENVIYIGGIDLHKSEDGGTSWSGITHWWGGYGLPNVHADQHSIEFRPGDPQYILSGNDGGVYLSTDGGSTWNHRNDGYNVTQFYSCAIHPTPNEYYFLAGSQDNGSQQFVNATDIVSTNEVTGGDGGFCFIDATDPNYQITSYTNNYYYLSTDGGQNFNYQNDNTSGGRFINPADYDDDSNILYTANDANSIYRWYMTDSDNDGNLDENYFNFDLGVVASHIRVSPYSENVIFIGTGAGRLFKVGNSNETSPSIVEIGSNDFPTGYVSCVELGENENQILVTFSNFGVSSVWESIDGGSTWAEKEGNLPDMPIRWAVYNPTNNNEVLLATEVGVWSSINFNSANPDWIPSNSGLANVRSDMLQIRQSDDLIIAATHGRGLFSSTGFQHTAEASISTHSISNSVSQGTIEETSFEISNIGEEGSNLSYIITPNYPDDGNREQQFIFYYDESVFDGSSFGALDLPYEGGNVTMTEFGTRFTPTTEIDILEGVWMFFGNFLDPDNSTIPEIVVNVYNADNNFPGTLLGQVEMVMEDFIGMGWNFIDLSPLNLSFNSGDDFFITVTVENGVYDVVNWDLVGVKLFTDLGGMNQNRSVIFYESSNEWHTYQTVYNNDNELLLKAQVYYADDPTESWLTTNPSSGIIASNETESIQVQLNATELPNGVYNATLIVDYNVGVSDTIDVSMTVQYLSVDQQQLNPNSFTVDQNFPNPFNPTTSISYELPYEANVQINIFDMKGRHVKQLMNQQQFAGQHVVKWDATSKQGHSVPSGQYFCTIKVNDSEKTIKLTLVK